jgi:hypothetical protein
MNTVSAASCLNCAAPLGPAQKYCGSCGQRVIEGRLTLAEIGHDVMHALTHADRSIFKLIAALIIRPGKVAREYIDGRRKSYFGPFAFLVIMVGVASFLTYLMGLQWFTSVPSGGARAFLARHFNLVILIQAPLLALGCQLLFFRSRLNFSEHLVLASYASGLRALFLGIVETPMRVALGGPQTDNWITLAYFAVWFSYFGYATAQFYGGNPWWAAFRGMLSALISVFLTSMIIFVFIYLMARFGGS